MAKDGKLNSGGKTYKSRTKSVRDVIGAALESAALMAGIAFLFYRSWWPMILTPILVWPYMRWSTKRRNKKRALELRYQFKEMLSATSGALAAGYSMENALAEAEKEVTALLGDKAEITGYLREINGKIRLNISAERALLEFGEAAGIEDITSFAQIFSYAKRSGGDYVRIMKNSAAQIQEKIEVEREIDTVIASKKMESRIMYLVPIGIILYLSFSSPDFLAPLYKTTLGVAVMSVCLLCYVAAIVWGEKLMDIKV